MGIGEAFIIYTGHLIQSAVNLFLRSSSSCSSSCCSTGSSGSSNSSSSSSSESSSSSLCLSLFDHSKKVLRSFLESSWRSPSIHCAIMCSMQCPICCYLRDVFIKFSKLRWITASMEEGRSAFEILIVNLQEISL